MYEKYFEQLKEEYSPENYIANELISEKKNLTVIGGALKTSNALDAIEEGFMAGISID